MGYGIEVVLLLRNHIYNSLRILLKLVVLIRHLVNHWPKTLPSIHLPLDISIIHTMTSFVLCLLAILVRLTFDQRIREPSVFLLDLPIINLRVFTCNLVDVLTIVSKILKVRVRHGGGLQFWFEGLQILRHLLRIVLILIIGRIVRLCKIYERILPTGIFYWSYWFNNHILWLLRIPVQLLLPVFVPCRLQVSSVLFDL